MKTKRMQETIQMSRQVTYETRGTDLGNRHKEIEKEHRKKKQEKTGRKTTRRKTGRKNNKKKQDEKTMKRKNRRKEKTCARWKTWM